MLPPVLYLVAAPQSRYIGLNNICRLHILAGPCLLRRHSLYLTTTIQFMQIVLLSGRGITQHQPRLQPHEFAIKRSVVVPPIALL
jgi:hypothetical protein